MALGKRSLIIRMFLSLASFFMWLLSFSVIRNWLVGRVMKKGQQKIIDARAKVVNKDR